MKNITELGSVLHFTSQILQGASKVSLKINQLILLGNPEDISSGTQIFSAEYLNLGTEK